MACAAKFEKWACVYFAIWGTVAPAIAEAHPTPQTRVEGKVTASRMYKLVITCDVAALVMQAPQGHIEGPLADELKNMPNKELEAKIQDAKSAFQQKLSVQFGGRPGPKPDILFPFPDELKQLPPHGSPVTQVIEVKGMIPLNEVAFTVSFSEELGPVELVLEGLGRTRFTQHLEKGLTSEPFYLDGSEPSAATADARRFVAYVVLSVFLLGLMLIRTLRQPVDHPVE